MSNIQHLKLARGIFGSCIALIFFVTSPKLAVAQGSLVVTNQTGHAINFIGVTIFQSGTQGDPSIPLGLTYGGIENVNTYQLLFGLESQTCDLASISWIEPGYGLRVRSFTTGELPIVGTVEIVIPKTLVLKSEVVIQPVTVVRKSDLVNKYKRPSLSFDIAAAFRPEDKPVIELESLRKSVLALDEDLGAPEFKTIFEQELWRYQFTAGFIAGLCGSGHSRSRPTEIMSSLFPKYRDQIFAGAQNESGVSHNDDVTKLFQLAWKAENSGFEKALQKKGQ